MALRSRTEKVLQSKWVYSVKTDAVGNVLKFKAQIVAVGSSQEKGVHYDETFSPVTNFGTMHLLFAVAVLTACFVDILDLRRIYEVV